MDYSSTSIFCTGSTYSGSGIGVGVTRLENRLISTSFIWKKCIKSSTSTVRDLFCFSSKDNDNVYTGVSTLDGGQNEFQILVKLDSFGSPLNKWRYSTGGDIAGGTTVNPIMYNACINKTTGEYYIIGAAKVFSEDRFNAFIIKYGPDDNFLWRRSISIPQNDCYGRSIWLNPAGDTVYAMFTYGGGTTQAIAKIPADGKGMGVYTLPGSDIIVQYNDAVPVTRILVSTLSIVDVSGYTTNNFSSSAVNPPSMSTLALTPISDTNTIIEGNSYSYSTSTILDTKTVAGNWVVSGTNYYGYSNTAIPPQGTISNGISNIYNKPINSIFHQASTQSITMFSANVTTTNTGWESMIIQPTGYSSDYAHYFNRKDGVFFSFGGNSTWMWYHRDTDGEALNDATVTFI
jgi:hypothetical protein